MPQFPSGRTAGTQTIVTVSNLEPNTPYDMKVAVWEDDKLELPSEVITAYTADGCVKDNRMYSVGEEYFLECDARCVCNGNNETSCTPRCNAPYVKIGSKEADPLCYEKPLPSDPCCVTIRCTESKFYGDNGESQNKSGECPEIFEESETESKSCLSDCDHDGDCSGSLKCCPSSCGGAVCVQPLLPEGKKRNLHTVLVFLDIKSAFDNAWWPGILSLLKRSSIPGNLFAVISSFLKDRSVTLSLGHSSKENFLNKGCPQGSVSGPFLWNVIINDFLEKILAFSSCETIAFADDLLLCFQGKSFHDICKQAQLTLDFASTWTKNFKLEFNAVKS
ncbi:hypothetical protein TNCV_1424921 [Trichonephila clavipes]|nr:hypothetical protein TNCV_1424921 [Trichonephila clavipes]